jgi:hypothetical protein
MTLTAWVDARLAAFAPVIAPLLAKAIVQESGPVVIQVEAALASDENALAGRLQTALNGAVAQAMVNLPATIAQAIKNLLPFPL